MSGGDAHLTVVLGRMSGATIVAATTGAHLVSRGVNGVVADTTRGSFDIIGCDGFFDCLVPIGIVSHKRSSGGFYLFECFVELCRKPTGWTVKVTKDFVVVTGGKFEIAVDMMSGSGGDVTVVHTETRVKGVDKGSE